MNKPPRNIPSHLIFDYTMGDRIPVKYHYFDSTRSGTTKVIYTTLEIDNNLVKINDRKTFHYGLTDTWLYKALDKYSIKKKNVAVMGSVRPVYESIVISYGGNPTTIEYNPIIADDIRLETVTVKDFDNNPNQFDAALSISSFEHDGLGRYGDPLNPNADIIAMEKMKTILTDNGILFLSVPIGSDTLVWNAHRVYGPLRLPKLLDGWKFLGFFPSTAPLLNPRVRDIIQPIFVLQNSNTADIYLNKFIRKLYFGLALKRPFIKPLKIIKNKFYIKK